MKTIITLILLSAATLSFADSSLKCRFTKNFKETIEVTQRFDEIDEEECSEDYFSETKDVRADILYLPYQEGIYLTITDKKTGASASTIHDESAEVTLRIGGNTYMLNCSEYL